MPQSYEYYCKDIKTHYYKPLIFLVKLNYVKERFIYARNISLYLFPLVFL
jgi:hypothetical protein